MVAASGGTMRTRIRGTLGENLRILWAITAKDILEAVKNKGSLAFIVGVLVVLAINRLYSSPAGANAPPNLLVYDAGDSSFVAALGGSSTVKLSEYPSQEELEQRIRSGDEADLALVIPADLSQRLDSGKEPVLEGYMVHWVSEAAANELVSRVEQEITQLVGQPVRINLEGNRVYLQPEAVVPGSAPHLASITLLMALTLVGLGVTPQLMFEEKQTRTLEALLVSPATSGQVVLGKALAGLFYSLTITLVVMALHANLIIHWGPALAAVIAGSLFTVAIGLFLGMLFATRQQFTLWAFVLLNVLLVPVFLYGERGLLPQAVNVVVAWIPTAALANIFWVSFSAHAPAAAFVPELALVVGCTALVLAVVAWLVRRSDR
jgi:ABC-2 type transport system permease protein